MKYIVQIPLNLEIDAPENMDREAIEQAIEDDLIVFISTHSVLRSISPAVIKSIKIFKMEGGRKLNASSSGF